MKLIVALFAIFFVASPAIANEDPLALQKKYGSEMQLVRSIWMALFEYEVENGRFPESLITLVTAKSMKAEALHIKLEDGAVQIPAYYPGRSSSGDPDTVIVAYNLPALDHRIVATVQGVIKIEEKPKMPNKAEMATPRKPSN